MFMVGHIFDRSVGNLKPTIIFIWPEHAKISHLVASLPISRQQVLFARLFPSYQQVWNKLLPTCNNLDLVDIIRLDTRLFQQV
jgi:hypothetical protein